MRKLILILTTVVICLGIIECTMRFMGYFILQIQDSRNQIYAKDKDVLRILTIGESTTADVYGEGPKGAWPRQLEVMLNSSGVPSRVYNVAIPATNSAELLSRLPDQLETYKPNIVISMMGINDPFGVRILPKNRGSFLSDLRLVKLFSWIGTAIFTGDKLRQEKALPIRSKDYSHLAESKGIISRLKKEPLIKVWPSISKEILAQHMDTVEEAKYLHYLAVQSEPERGSTSVSFTNSFELYGKSLHKFYSIENAAARYLFLMSKVSNYEDCKWAAKTYLEKGYEISPLFSWALNNCASKASDKKEFYDLINNSSQKISASNYIDGKRNTSENYCLLYETLASKKIRLVAMQYPTLNPIKVKSYFSHEHGCRSDSANKNNVIFVGNLINFQSALKKLKYEDLFTDKFAPTFGHTTNLGHELIAKSALAGILEIMKDQYK